jgi:hypothetical protein
MRRKCLVGIVSCLSRCSQMGGVGCVLPLKIVSFPSYSSGVRQHFQSSRWYFLTFRRPAITLPPIRKQRTGSNFHRRVAFVFRFFPTSR